MSIRVFRLVAGALVALVGLAVLAAGGVAAFWVVGPDDVLSTRSGSLSSKGVAIVSAPSLVDYFGSNLVVSARPGAKGREVFLGVAHHIETSSYLGRSARTELTDVGYPSSLETREVEGLPARVTPPEALDWWVARATGSGTQVLEWELADGPYDLVIMSADGRPGVDVTATFGIELKGAFRTSLAGAGLGLLVLAGGVLLLRGPRRPRSVDDDDDVLWEGRDLWDQNEFWGAGEPVTRGGATVGAGSGPTPGSRWRPSTWCPSTWCPSTWCPSTWRLVLVLPTRRT